MNTPAPPPSPPGTPGTPRAGVPPASAALPLEIQRRGDFAPAVLAVLQAALDRDARTLLWVDPDFAAWPLDDPALITLLTGWLQRPLRRLQLLAVDYDGLARAHPRFAAWRAAWAHAIDARRPDEPARTDLPTLLLDDGPVLLEMLERDPPRGRAARDAQAAWRARDAVAGLWARAEPAWPLRPLGL